MNYLTEIELSGCTALKNLGLELNELTSLDISYCPDLESLNFASNQISEIDLSDQTEIHSLLCSENQLRNLDVSNLPDLIQLFCGLNQLSSLNLSNNSNLGMGLDESYGCYLEIGDMPTLEEVCVWTELFPPDGFFLCMDGSPNVNFSTNCTYAK
jgi:Leucine-rich repeat (LRR) protein